jgi:hypothetical protein
MIGATIVNYMFKLDTLLYPGENTPANKLRRYDLLPYNIDILLFHLLCNRNTTVHKNNTDCVLKMALDW